MALRFEPIAVFLKGKVHLRKNLLGLKRKAIKIVYAKKLHFY